MQNQSAPEAERSVLGCVLLGAEIPDLTSEHFTVSEYSRIWDAIKHLQADNKAIDLVTVCTRLNSTGDLERIGGPEEIADIQNFVPIATHLPQYVEIVKNRKKLRDINRICDETMRMEASPDEMVSHALARLKNVSDPVTSRPLIDVLQDYQNNKDIKGLDSGLPFFDKKVGGIVPGWFYVLAAYSATGKTTLALQMAANICDNYGKKVVLYSLEMSDTNVIRTLDRIQKNRGQSLDPVSCWRFEIVTDLYNWDKIAVDAQRRGADFIIVDYAQMLQGEGKSLQEKLANIAFSIRAFCNETKIATLLLSQISEGTLKEKSSHDGAKGGGDLFAASDVFLNLRGDAKAENEQRTEYVRNGVNVGFQTEFDRYFLVAKNKYGVPGATYLKYDWRDGRGVYVDFKKSQ